VGASLQREEYLVASAIGKYHPAHLQNYKLTDLRKAGPCSGARDPYLSHDIAYLPVCNHTIEQSLVISQIGWYQGLHPVAYQVRSEARYDFFVSLWCEI